jgi:2-polyprenyl-3-methyl-5-hydroxy-6-metoxy-1,4-benzoquinol methylase
VQFLSPQLSDAELGRLYSENYYAAWGIKGNAENETTRQMKMATFQLRLDTIRRFLRRPAGMTISADPGRQPGPSASVATSKILDVGCATGYFLELAQQQGFIPYGVEFSPYSAGIAKKKFGDDKIFEGTLEQFSANPSFQVIAMSDLIEHVRNPVATLTTAAQLLTDNGLIMIMTPDTATLSNQLMGRRWTHYKAEHFFYFNRRSMGYLAAKCGLQMLHYERSKKALNIDYLHTQFNVYRHWLLTPVFNFLHRLLPAAANARNFYISIGEMVVILRSPPNR